MKENLIVEMIAGPILEALEAMEASGSFKDMPSVPDIHLVWASDSGDVEFEGQKLDEDLIRRVEVYLQEKVMEIEHPTLLH